MTIFSKKILWRVIFDVVFFVFIFLLPWYVAVPIIAFSIIFFNNFWEGILAALAMDSFYYTPANSPDLRFGIFFFFAVAIAIFSGFVKSKIRFGGLGNLN